MNNHTNTIIRKSTQNRIKPLPYPLNILKNYLEKFSPPEKPFIPDDEWKSEYKMFSMASGRAGHAGTLLFKRKPLSEKEAFIELTIDKAGIDRYWQKTNAKIKFKTDLLSSPVKWQYESKITKPNGELLKNTEIKKYAVNQDGKINVICKHNKTVIKSSRNIAMSWLLFDAVQRMPKEKSNVSDFTLIDHFDQFKPNNTISFQKKIEINTTEKLELYSFLQLGNGIIPIVYYVNKYGQLLFVVSGIEAYALV